MSDWRQHFQAHYYHFAEINSTQTYLLAHAHSDLPIICEADVQTAAHGQRDRHWEAPTGQLYISFCYPFSKNVATHQGLAQYIALTLVESLDANRQQLQLKWPNDIFLNGKKMGGILIDMIARGDACDSVIGIGLNLVRGERGNPDFAYYDDEANHPTLDKSAFIEHVLRTLAAWEEKPYLPVDNRWNDYDRFYGKTCQLENIAEPAQLLGIDQKGRLIAKYAGALHFLTTTRISQCIS